MGDRWVGPEAVAVLGGEDPDACRSCADEDLQIALASALEPVVLLVATERGDVSRPVRCRPEARCATGAEVRVAVRCVLVVA